MGNTKGSFPEMVHWDDKEGYRGRFVESMIRSRGKSSFAVLRLKRIFGISFEYLELDLKLFENQIDELHLVKDSDTWWRKMKFQGRRR